VPGCSRLNTTAEGGQPLESIGKVYPRPVRQRLLTALQRADNWIAGVVGLSYHTVRQVRVELEATGEIQKVGKVERSDGKTAPAHGAKFAPSTQPEPKPMPWDGKVFCPADDRPCLC